MTKRLLVLLFMVGAATGARAEVVRFAVIVGNNQGEADEGNLRFAEADAEKMRDLLLDLGDFRHENIVLMQGESATAVRQAIVATNDRIRALPDAAQAVLLVYYSGHADARELHLGRSGLAVRELEQLVSGSAAGMRLLIVDACRSGSLTRVKGGTKAPAFDIVMDERLAARGAVALTSSSASEDAQESDALAGSFFTHYLVSGALGAADANGDDVVSLAEAYRYAYEHTLRASSKTLAGLQHPTFRYDVAGYGDFVFTRLGRSASHRGRLAFPKGRSYLVLKGDAEGQVIGEIGLHDAQRTISVRPGNYFIRGRGQAYLLEGRVVAVAAQRTQIDDGALEKIAYARLVRKGGVLPRVATAFVSGALHTAGANAARPCVGGDLGYGVAWPSLEFALLAGGCRSSFDTSTLRATVSELRLSARVAYAWDRRAFTLAPYLGVGGGVLRQQFSTRGEAPTRHSAFGRVDAGVTVRRQLAGAIYGFVDASVQTYLFRQQAHADALRADTSLNVALGVGAWF
ncbi:MAG: caspase family protein [Myxococcales bacterium]|nr:caspase family protein [Myxococcales bacterium]